MINTNKIGDGIFNFCCNTVYTSPLNNHSNCEEIFDLQRAFSKLTDIRQASGLRHKIGIVMTVAVLSIMHGYDNFHAMDDFVKRYKYNLIFVLHPKKNRIPSSSTIRRVIKNVDFDELNCILEKWGIKNIKVEKGDWLSLDGKCIKGTIPDEEHKLINLVSLFSHKQKQVLLNHKVNEKSNEIPTTQEIIEKNDIQDIVYIADALHCQKMTAEKIWNTQNNYVLQVKANQKTLLRKVKYIARILPTISKHTTKEKNRGRLETRTVTVHKECLDLDYYGWKDIKFIVKVDRKVKHKSGKETNETAYFITNLQEDASVFNKGIRDHWKIENSLHYVKDVTFNEDRLRIRTGNAPQNMSLLRTLVINIYRQNGYHSIKQAIRLNQGNIVKMVSMFR